CDWHMEPARITLLYSEAHVITGLLLIMARIMRRGELPEHRRHFTLRRGALVAERIRERSPIAQFLHRSSSISPEEAIPWMTPLVTPPSHPCGSTAGGSCREVLQPGS